ncbi:hypothetical protein [Comamonas sp.]|uniref:hypothetical protein n=1 Tax=Comamonas sp. TaxID=34028 RepID=UPI003A90B89C
MTTDALKILLHATDAEGLQRARMNAVNALRAEPATQIRIITNAGGVAAALDAAHEATDGLTWLCPNTLQNLQRELRAPLQLLDGPAVLALARLQTQGWVYIRS